jgi:hypothetical protein
MSATGNPPGVGGSAGRIRIEMIPIDPADLGSNKSDLLKAWPVAGTLARPKEMVNR